MTGQPSPEDPRQRQAIEFLREAVVHARLHQGIRGLFAEGRGERGGCGLGEGPGAVLDLTERAVLLASSLWPEGLAAEERERVRGAMQAWVGRQDALDRDRNHLLKRFRQAHGTDRAAWPGETLKAFEEGLATINRRETAERAEAARALLLAW